MSGTQSTTTRSLAVEQDRYLVTLEDNEEILCRGSCEIGARATEIVRILGPDRADTCQGVTYAQLRAFIERNPDRHIVLLRDGTITQLG